MNTEDFRNDVKLVLKARKTKAHRLAAHAGVDKSSMWRFLNKKANLNTDSFFKLWTHIYGNQRPRPLLEQSGTPEEIQENSHE